MAFSPFFHGYLEHLPALGWTVHLSNTRIALYPRRSHEDGSRPTVVLQYAPVVPTGSGAQCDTIYTVRPYHLYDQRLYGARTFFSWQTAALLFLKDACDFAPREEPLAPTPEPAVTGTAA